MNEEAELGRRPRLRRTARIVLLLVLLLVVASGSYVGYAAIRAAQPVTLPAPTGSYPVGRTSFESTDDSRTDPLAPRSGLPRQLSVWLWYPAAPGPAARPAPYAPGAWTGLHLHGLPGLGETSFDEIHNHAFADVPVAAGRFPIVVLAPGLGFSAPQYTALAENLASHGYLVAGVTPTYSANLTVLNGQPISSTEAGAPVAFNSGNLHSGQAQTAGDQLVNIWAADEHFVAAQVATLDTKQDPFAGHVTADTTVYLGHSFGGAAALQACGSDPQCAGAADLDGTQYGSVVHTGLAKPVLLIGSENSCATGICPANSPADVADRDTAKALVTASTGPVWCYRIKGAGHFNFSDYGSYYLAAPIRSQLALGPIDGVDALTIANAYLAAFVDHETQHRPEPLLTGRSTPYPQIDVEHIPS